MKINEVTDDLIEYGMTKGGANMRSQNSQYMNSTKRINNKNADGNREIMIKQNSQNRRQNRLAKKQPTGLPNRLLNPQQPQSPTGQA